MWIKEQLKRGETRRRALSSCTLDGDLLRVASEGQNVSPLNRHQSEQCASETCRASTSASLEHMLLPWTRGASGAPTAQGLLYMLLLVHSPPPPAKPVRGHRSYLALAREESPCHPLSSFWGHKAIHLKEGREDRMKGSSPSMVKGNHQPPAGPEDQERAHCLLFLDLSLLGGHSVLHQGPGHCQRIHR